MSANVETTQIILYFRHFYASKPNIKGCVLQSSRVVYTKYSELLAIDSYESIEFYCCFFTEFLPIQAR